MSTTKRAPLDAPTTDAVRRLVYLYQRRSLTHAELAARLGEIVAPVPDATVDDSPVTTGEAVLDALKAYGPMTLSACEEAIGGKRNTLYHAIRTPLRQGLVQEVGRANPGDRTGGPEATYAVADRKAAALVRDN